MAVKQKTEKVAPKRKVSVEKTIVKKDIIKSIKFPPLIKGKKFSKKQIWIVASIIIVLGILYFGKGLLVAAIVDGQPISRLSVVSELEKQGGKTALDSLVTKTLILNEAKKKNITVNQTDVDNQIKNIQTQIESQGSTLDQELAAQGMTKTDLSDQVRIQLILDKLVGQNVSVSDKEISDYIAANKDQLPQGATDATLSAQVKQQITQQKVQQKVQVFLQSLRNKAKITYFINY